MASHVIRESAWPRAILIAVTVGILTTSCDQGRNLPPDPVESVYQSPEAVRDATIVWSSEPGVDLHSGEAALARAGFEAHYVGQRAGLNNTYPGFSQAISQMIQSELRTTYGQFAVLGTLRAHIQAIHGESRNFVADICILGQTARLEDGKYWSWSARAGATRISADAQSEEARLPVAPVAIGPAERTWQAPTYNLFKGWSIDFPYGSVPDDRSCDPWALSVDPNLPEPPVKYERSAPPPVLPAFPGWPAESPIPSQPPPTSSPTIESPTTTPR
jgi:hypothetical protein